MGKEEDYLKFKQLVAVVFGSNEQVTLDDDIIVALSFTKDVSGQDAESGASFQTIKKEIVIPQSELKDYFDALSCSDADVAYMPSTRHYEYLVTTESNRPNTRNWSHERESAESLLDPTTGCCYSLGPCTCEYILLLLLYYIEERRHIEKSLYYSVPPFVLSRKARGAFLREEDMNSRWEELLSLLFFAQSIKITSENVDLSIEEFQARAISYEFFIMYSKGFSISRKTHRELFFKKKLNTARRRSRSGGIAPLKAFDKEAVDYYRLALSTDDPYLQYLSYYHVLEYYFPMSYKKGVAALFRDEITSVGFSLDDDKLFDVAQKINEKMAKKHETGFGNEKNELTFVLKEHIPNPEDLLQSIHNLDQNAVSYYANTKVEFVGKTPCINESMPAFHENVATRVYKTRNALIHSKNQDMGGRYNHYRDQECLAREIPLIRSLAELVIDRAGVLFPVHKY